MLIYLGIELLTDLKLHLYYINVYIKHIGTTITYGFSETMFYRINLISKNVIIVVAL